jgi:tetratricopeptide (TPR) repeat protein
MTSGSNSPFSFWQDVHRLLLSGHHTDALRQLATASASDQTGQAALALGVMYRRNQQTFQAICAWTQSLEQASGTGQRAVLQAVCHNFSGLYRELGDEDLASRFQQRALAYQDDFGAEDLLLLVNSALVNERWELAESLLTAAEELDGCESVQAELMATRGVLLGLTGHPQQGRDWLVAAYRRHLAQEHWQAASQDLINFAALCEQTDHLRVARRCLVSALEHLQCAPSERLEHMAAGALKRVNQQLHLRLQTAQWN